MKKTTTLGLLILLLAAGCGKHAAAEPARHNETAAAPALPSQKQQESETCREQCRRTKPLFC